MKDFIKEAIRTESPNFDCPDPRVLHAAIGLVTESAELIDALKKAMYYGKSVDITNIKEEAGDILWYLAILFDALDTDFDTEQKRVIAKLKARFPDKFTNKCAAIRDLSKEREILEKED
jgi:NTP pyrophosphatase (non-canonical NTP hydrolase)